MARRSSSQLSAFGSDFAEGGLVEDEKELKKLLAKQKLEGLSTKAEDAAIAAKVKETAAKPAITDSSKQVMDMKKAAAVQAAGTTIGSQITAGGTTQSTTAGAAGGAASGAASGFAMTGSPIGAAAGAVIGGVAGGLGAKSRRKEAARQRFAEAKRKEAEVIGQADERKQRAIANLINSFQGIELGGTTIIG